MNNILAIAKNTFKETIRDKVLYGIVGFAVLFLISTIFISALSLGEDVKVVRDLGLAGIYVFTILITIFLGTPLISKELEKRTIYIILSKPVSTLQFILGKALGLLLGISLNLSIMTVLYLAIVLFKGGGFDGVAMFSILLLLFEVILFISLTVLLSTFTTPLAGTIYSVIILYTGHSLSMLKTASIESGNIFSKALGSAAYYLFPNLEKFNLRNTVVYGNIPSAGQIIYPVIYALCFSVILLWLANIALKKQDL